jgi:hypothetical protein
MFYFGVIFSCRALARIGAFFSVRSGGVIGTKYFAPLHCNKFHSVDGRPGTIKPETLSNDFISAYDLLPTFD